MAKAVKDKGSVDGAGAEKPTNVTGKMAESGGSGNSETAKSTAGLTGDSALGKQKNSTKKIYSQKNILENKNSVAVDANNLQTNETDSKEKSQKTAIDSKGKSQKVEADGKEKTQKDAIDGKEKTQKVEADGKEKIQRATSQKSKPLDLSVALEGTLQGDSTSVLNSALQKDSISALVAQGENTSILGDASVEVAATSFTKKSAKKPRKPKAGKSSDALIEPQAEIIDTAFDGQIEDGQAKNQTNGKTSIINNESGYAVTDLGAAVTLGTFGKNDNLKGYQFVGEHTDDELAQFEHGAEKRVSNAARLKQIRKMRAKKPLDIDDIERIEADIKQGLSKEQVESQFEKGYVNVTALRTGKTYFGIIMSNTFTFFNILAFIVAIAMLLTKPTLTQMFFIFIIFANIVIGIFQEIRAKLSIDKLQIITAPSATVIRDGHRKSIPLEEVVLDDIMYLETGKQISADSIVLSGECEVNESMITGESVSVKKTVGDVVYSGSYLSSGSVYSRVDKVGEANYAQTLTASAKKYQKPKSELNNSIRLIMKIATIFIIPITATMILTYLFQNKGTNVNEAIRSISGAVIGMIPAGMFLLTTVALATSVVKLASKKTIVKDLYCIEMLARVDTLCLDKTGTITDGSMTVQRVIKFRTDEAATTLETAIGSMLSATEDNNQTALALAAKFGYNTELQAKNIVPFSSHRKYSMVSFEGCGTYILGAPEYVLKDMGVRIERLVSENTAAGYRVIMLAHSPQMAEGDKIPQGRKAIAMIVIQDQIREDAIETIRWFKENDVAVKVISGDNPITVSEIAKRVGVENAELYISLDGLNDQEIIEASSKYTVFGRVTPEQKSLLVRSMKAKGHTVAMTGDGVNDILAMRESDCAISIASGSEAARNVSHLVLVNNNFTAMPDIVLEGRRVVNNIQKSSALFLMKTIMSIFLALIYAILRKDYPISTDNLFLLEVFVIGFPSTALALQPNKNRIQGKFLANVIGRALPGGLALILAVQSAEIFQLFLPDIVSDQLKMSMLVICLTFTAFIVLCKICEPLNFYRSFLLICSVALIMTAILLVGDQFGIKSFETKVEYFHLTCILFIISEVLLSYFVITFITKLLGRAGIIFD